MGAITTRRQVIKETAVWLKPLLPGYAQQFVDDEHGDIDFGSLVDDKMLGMYSTGERAALSLAGHLLNYPGVIQAAHDARGFPDAMITLLTRIPADTHRRRYLAIFVAYAEGLVG